MYSEWARWSRIGIPAKNDALYIVVANCEMPPPTSSRISPRKMAPSATKPFSMVRLPTKSLTEKVSPGRSTWPRMMSAIRWMLVTRFAQHEW